MRNRQSRFPKATNGELGDEGDRRAFAANRSYRAVADRGSLRGQPARAGRRERIPGSSKCQHPVATAPGSVFSRQSEIFLRTL